MESNIGMRINDVAVLGILSLYGLYLEFRLRRSENEQKIVCYLSNVSLPKKLVEKLRLIIGVAVLLFAVSVVDDVLCFGLAPCR